MTTTHLDPAALRSIGHVAPDEPVVMLNLLRFREEADYGGDTDLAPCSGRSAYFERYVPAFRALAPTFGGAEAVYLGAAHDLLVGEDDERWDTVALLRYPSLDAMQRFLDDDRYLRDAAPHRIAALADWRFLVTTPL